MAASLQTHFLKTRPFHFRASTSSSRPTSLRCTCSAATPSTKRSYKITLLPGDGIGPEVVSVAKDVLLLTGSLHGIKLEFQEKLLGGAAIDATGLPLPDDTLSVSKQSDAILLGAIGGYKWDKNEKHLKPETGLLQLREGLQVFANLRPATVFPQLVDASTLKREIAEGVDLMVVRELTGGIYFGKPRGFNTEIYAAHEIDRIACVAFNIARKHGRKLCSVDKANVLEASMLWRKRVTALAQEYPDVELSHMYVDNVAMVTTSAPKLENFLGSEAMGTPHYACSTSTVSETMPLSLDNMFQNQVQNMNNQQQQTTASSLSLFTSFHSQHRTTTLSASITTTCS